MSAASSSSTSCQGRALIWAVMRAVMRAAMRAVKPAVMGRLQSQSALCLEMCVPPDVFTLTLASHVAYGYPYHWLILSLALVLILDLGLQKSQAPAPLQRP